MNCKHTRKDKSARKYSEEHDTYYCEQCNKWLEPKCNDSAYCGFCPDRPDKPINKPK